MTIASNDRAFPQDADAVAPQMHTRLATIQCFLSVHRSDLDDDGQR
jgi:hypothetical protein